MSETNNYLKNLPQDQRDELIRIRTLVKKCVPEAKESFSYGMPAFTYMGKPLLYFGAFKNHLSIFPTSNPISKLKEQLKDFTITKGSIHFTTEQQLPDSVIKQLLQLRVEDIS